MTRGQSKATQAAEKYLEKNPSAKAAEIAAKFGIDLSTVTRSAWWKARPAKPSKVKEQTK